MPFDKRSLRWESVFIEMQRWLKNTPTVLGVFVSGRVEPSLRERIMLTVSVANRCRYCALVHALWARLHGLQPDEIRRLLQPDAILPKPTPGSEQVALEVARDFVRAGGVLSEAARRRLAESYGDAPARDIEALMHTIDLANLSGNTFDAFLSRWRGDRVADANVPLEALVFQWGALIYLPLLAIIAVARRRVSWLEALPH